jgi:hypothetical protein
MTLKLGLLKKLKSINRKDRKVPIAIGMNYDVLALRTPPSLPRGAPT